MRLYYISFFYYNIILFLFFFLQLDILFFFLIFLRKSYSIYKESLTEYSFQEFDGLRKNNQLLDLYENKLYVDFGLDIGLEENYTYNLYMNYALYGIYLDFELYNGHFTFKWNDFNVEEINYKNLKKNFLNIESTNLYYWKNIKEQMNTQITDDDYLHLYNYRSMHKRDFDDLLFNEENEKYYYNNLKKYFMKDNYYDVYVNDNYYNILNYNIFIKNIKKKIMVNKKEKKNNTSDLKYGIELLNLNENIENIKLNILNSSYLNKI